MPRSMICVEAQMGRPSTCRTQMARKSILKPRGGLGSYQHPEDTPGTLSSAAWVHVGRAEKRSVSLIQTPEITFKASQTQTLVWGSTLLLVVLFSVAQISTRKDRFYCKAYLFFYIRDIREKVFDSVIR